MKTLEDRVRISIRKIRTEKGFTQNNVAEMMDIPQSTYSRYERGATKIDLEFIENFAKALEIDVVDVFTYPEKYVKNLPESNEIRTIIQIELRKEKKDQVLRLVFGDENLDLLK